MNINNIDKYRGFDIIISHKFEFIYCLILKNGSSSIMNSILKYEYNDTYENENGIIWDHIKYNFNKYYTFYNDIFISFTNPDELRNFLIPYKDYKKFIVINDPYKRLLSWFNFFPRINFKQIDLESSILLYLDINKININFINEYNSNSISNTYVEYHCLPLHIFYDFFYKAIGDELEIVNLTDLQKYCKHKFNFNLIVNNKTKTKVFNDIPNLILNDKIWEVIKTQNLYTSN